MSKPPWQNNVYHGKCKLFSDCTSIEHETTTLPTGGDQAHQTVSIKLNITVNLKV